MMGGVALSFLCSCGYYAMLHEWSGFICSVVAIIGFLVQALIPKLSEQEYAWGRGLVSIIVILVAVSFMYEKTADLLPILGFSTARIFETQLQEHRLRFGYFAASFFWVAYAISIGHPVLIIAYMLISVSCTYALFRGQKIVEPEELFTPLEESCEKA